MLPKKRSIRPVTPQHLLNIGHVCHDERLVALEVRPVAPPPAQGRGRWEGIARRDREHDFDVVFDEKPHDLISDRPAQPEIAPADFAQDGVPPTVLLCPTVKGIDWPRGARCRNDPFQRRQGGAIRQPPRAGDDRRLLQGRRRPHFGRWQRQHAEQKRTGQPQWNSRPTGAQGSPRLLRPATLVLGRWHPLSPARWTAPSEIVATS